ncbi:hypothetical protein ACFVT9_38415 [Kitasatospora cineracea]|uniref:hypothetical protein n=1 Tax=Kitasatospora cineracea TaxID=88074 RepID=UPI0036DE30E0
MYAAADVDPEAARRHIDDLDAEVQRLAKRVTAAKKAVKAAMTEALVDAAVVG